MGTILFFQLSGIAWPMFWIMSLAIFNGLLTSITLKTIILARQMAFVIALKTALGMSLSSMISMEVAMNTNDYMLTGGATLTWCVAPIMLATGFVTLHLTITVGYKRSVKPVINQWIGRI